MKLPLSSFIVLLACATPLSAASDSKQSAPSMKEAAKSHTLKGVVVAIDADASALRVKHEEIPGVMRAMTMQFQVDAATLKAVKSGDAITAQMSRGDGMWRLTDVKVVEAKKK